MQRVSTQPTARSRDLALRTILVQGLLLGSGWGAVSVPVLNPEEGDSLARFYLNMSCATPGATIRYTLDGSDPTTTSAVYSSVAKVLVDRNWTVKATAWNAGEKSATVKASYMLFGDLSAGAGHSMAMNSSGDVWSWGYQVDGRLGHQDGTSATSVFSPERAFIGNAGVMVAAGKTHSTFLKTGGTVFSCGSNSTGQLGNNTTSNSYMVQVRKGTSASNTLTGVIAVDAGDGFSAAVTSDGSVYTWGSRVAGRLGDTTTLTGNRLYAGVVNMESGSPLAGIGQLSLGADFAFAKDTTGAVWAWGSNNKGQIGQGSTTEANYPRALKVKSSVSVDFSDATDVSCGESHAALVRWKSGDPAVQGRVYCVGQRQYGRLGNLPASTGSTVLNADASVSYPEQVIKGDGTALEGIVSVAAGSAHTLALDGSGGVWAWGYNGAGALGDNSSTSRGFAAKVKNAAGTADLTDIVRISAGGSGVTSFSMAVSASGTIYLWGSNSNGQLGDNTTDSLLPKTIGLDLLLPNPPSVSLATSVTTSSYPGAVTLTATPTDPDHDVSKVEFFWNGSLVGRLTTPPWVLGLTHLTEGNHSVQALVTDATSLQGYSEKSGIVISYDSGALTADRDGDGLTDSTEAAMGLSATDADTDGDGIPDGADNAPTIPDTVPLTAATLLIWAPGE